MSVAAATLDPRAVLENGLRTYLGRPVRINAVAVTPWPTSSHAIDLWCVTVDSGERFGIIFKRLEPGEKLYGNEREVLIYRHLLAGRRFGAPELYASTYEPARGCYWLFLEDVGPRTLKHAGLNKWRTVVRWLAGMHASYWGRADELRRLGCLGEHDAPFYRQVAAAARRNLKLAGAARSTVDRFDRALDDFDMDIAFLTRRPQTLLHGDLFPQNLILQPGPHVRPVDWESAAIGPGAWDLTRLLDGWGADKPKLVKLYLDELERRADQPLDRRGFHATLERCATLNVLWHLRWSVEACREAVFVAESIARLEALAGRRRHGGGDG